MLILDARMDLSLSAVRGRLEPPTRPARVLAALGAAALAAVAALALAGAVILGPPQHASLSASPTAAF